MMFHSIGMPAGLLMPIQPWKLVISSSAAIVTMALSAASSRMIGIEYSVSVPK